MNVSIHESWESRLFPEFQKTYFTDLNRFVTREYENHTCYPKEKDIFAAFNHCPFHQIKVVIIGQDPYHGHGQANGLSFSVQDGIKHPPSLVNIFKELEKDLGVPYPESGNLKPWANQGVFLLNATLTVKANEAGSHQRRGWEQFTDAVIQKLSSDRNALVFLLWGAYAKRKIKLIDLRKHEILTTGHPSPLSANRGYWFGNKHFSKTNQLLLKKNITPIDWV
ncbi:uracil-DNA glycosylase [bacterium]|nr:uracil-DNA glycosylase [bacterium]